MVRTIFLFGLVVMTAACAPAIKTQAVPVSTTPSGATVNVDGQQQLVSPCTVDLACTQDHILSFSKEGYQQQDVAIKRKYQEQKVLLSAINSGISSGTFFGDAAMGITSGLSSIDSQQDTGEAYVLSPSTVSVRMVPVGGFATTTTQTEVDQAVTDPSSPLDLLDSHDEQMLEHALESSASGMTASWNNGQGTGFSVVPQDARTQNGRTVRPFSLAATLDGSQTVKHYLGVRVGRGEWQIRAVPSGTKQVPSGPQSPSVLKTLGEVNWPRVGKSSKIASSSKRSTHVGQDGTVTTKSSSTSVSAGVHVSPKAAFKLLDALDGDE
ncbi:PEGA domain-containing protein [Desulfoplanes sp.]